MFPFDLDRLLSLLQIVMCFFFTVGLNVGAMSLVVQYDHGRNPTDQRDLKAMNHE